MAGRGLLGHWGPNEAIAALVTRDNTDSGGTDVLLGRKVGQHSLSVPRGFRLAGEEMDSALSRVLEEESGWRPSSVGGEVVLKGYSYDPRQTDHAWVELEARHIQVDDTDAPALFRPGEQFDEMAWVPINEETLGELVPAHAPILQDDAFGLAVLGGVQLAVGRTSRNRAGSCSETRWAPTRIPGRGPSQSRRWPR